MWRRAWAARRGRPAAAALAALAAAAPAPRPGAGPGRCEEDWRARAQRLELELAALRRRVPREEAPCHTVVLTGGPCAGKTTVLMHLKEKLENLGFVVYISPEAATFYFTTGVRFLDFVPLGENALAAVQAQITRMQIHVENSFKELARVHGRPTVILCDRGAMDGKAYISPELWALILEDLGATESMMRDKRYDAVVHLVTAARGAESFYTLQQAEGAGSRTETAEEARVQDEKTLRCWVGHPHFFVVDNSTDFKHKVQRATDRILKVVGKSVPGHTLRKFKVAHMSIDEVTQALQSAGVDTFQLFRSEQVFLSPKKRIRMRCSQDGQQAFYTVQEEIEEGTVIERQMAGRDYISDRAAARERGIPVCEKQLVVFEWGTHLMELNIFKDPEPVCIVEVEAESKDAAISVPSFLQTAGIAKEVTDDPEFDSYAISQRLQGRTSHKG